MSYWKNYWNNIAENKSSLKQVQRDDLSASQLLVIEKHISKVLKINSEDELLDVCCGNGLITMRIAKQCKSVVGIDFSAKLVEAADGNKTCENLRFIEGDATDLSVSLDQKFDKILLNFSFQYFNYKEGLQVVSGLKKRLKPGGLLFIGDIPNQNKWWSYYDTFLKRGYYLKQWICRQPKMGKFWSEKELKSIARKNDMYGEVLEQTSNLPYSHYRFDFLLKHSKV